MKKIRIGDKLIGYGEPCFIIAEAGVNHNGDIELAKKLVEEAKDTGADAIKFQTYKAENVVTKHAQRAEYQRVNIGGKGSQQEMLKRVELKYEDFEELKEHCDRRGVIFLSTPHSDEAIDFLDKLVPAYKIGSGDLTNIPFLQKVAEKGKPMIVSTGMATMKEVKEAVDLIDGYIKKDLVILHCTTSYPCPARDVNLRAMVTLQNELDLLIGYSDHTLGLTVPIMAVTLGAVVLEKHFTLNKNLTGPDHKASLEPYEFKEMVEKIREVEVILGCPEKRPSSAEMEIMRLVRKSVVAKMYIQEGTKISRDMLVIKRPGMGLIPKEIENIVGRFAKKDIQKDELISLDMLV